MFSVLEWRLFRCLCAGVALWLSLAASPAQAGTSSIWTNCACDPPLLQEWDLNGNLLHSIPAPHGHNGRGIAKVGNVLYYTVFGSNAVYAYNFATNTDLGTAFTAGSPGSLAYDGSSFYVAGYGSTTLVYKYSLTGTGLGAISLGNCGPYYFCDGLEYANGKLLQNRWDEHGPYDLYDLSGAVLQPGFLHDPANTYNTGLAFDGTNYFMSRPVSSEIVVFDINGVYQHAFTLIGGSGKVEDLAVDYPATVLKLCKVAGFGITPGRSFNFLINGKPLSVTAGPYPDGTCTIAGTFPANTAVSLQEVAPSQAPYFSVSVTPPQNMLGQPVYGVVHLTTGSGGVTEVKYTNYGNITRPGGNPPGPGGYIDEGPGAERTVRPAMGTLEICKQGSLTGNFTFTVNPGHPAPLVVAAHTCSSALSVPAGSVVIHEGATPNVGVVDCYTFPPNRQGACNPLTATSTVSVPVSALFGQTIATITNQSTIQGGRSNGAEVGATVAAPPRKPASCSHPDPMLPVPESCSCPQGQTFDEGKCVKKGSFLDDIHIGVKIGIGKGSSGEKPKTCEPSRSQTCP